VVALLAVAVATLPLADAIALPTPNSAVMNLRVFNDCPTSVVTTVNNYPALLSIEDAVLDCTGFANLHNWRFSEDGMNPAVFNNGDSFMFGCDLVISGTADGESGLQISPWWSQDVDGRLNVRTTDGEIACFGGRLPFFSFTGTFGLTYVKGTSIHLEMTYRPYSLTQADPGTIQYVVVYNSMTYDSGEIPFDEGNPNEPYGTWGILDDARVGGHVQCFLQAGNPDANLKAEWTNIEFEVLPVPVEPSSWGQIKATYKQ
jgi:hypothetical protein